MIVQVSASDAGGAASLPPAEIWKVFAYGRQPVGSALRADRPAHLLTGSDLRYW